MHCELEKARGGRMVGGRNISHVNMNGYTDFRACFLEGEKEGT